jgi:hypothetical protein
MTDEPGYDSRKSQRDCSQHADRLWGPPNLPPAGYRGLCPEGKAAGVQKLFTNLQLVLRLINSGAIPPLCHVIKGRNNFIYTNNFTSMDLLYLEFVPFS